MSGDIEDVKHEVALVIASAVFTAALAAVDVEKRAADATPLPTIVHEFAKMTLSDQGYPVAEVVGHRTSYDVDDQQGHSATHDIEVIWTHVGDDEQTITRVLERLVRATRDVFCPPANGPVTLGAIGSAPVVLVAEEYSQLMPSSVKAFCKGASTRLQILTL